MLSEKLKEQTSNNHQVLEKKLLAQMRNMQSKQDYAALLKSFYSYFGGLEVAINKQLDLSALPDYSKRRKTAVLANDIIYLAAPLPALADETSLPAIINHAQAMGALYVIEGSTLGGKIISKMVSRQLNLTGIAGLSFFNGYGDDTDKMWGSFKIALNNTPNVVADEVILAANETFIKFGDWLAR